MPKWDFRYLRLAREIATWSKDGSTKCGAVIVRPDKTICSLGYNGFPRQMPDEEGLYEDRGEKYSRILHAEMNAILTAPEPVRGYTLYTYPFLTCERCSVHVIQAGITRVVAPKALGDRGERWNESLEKSRNYYAECDVQCVEYDLDLENP